MSSVTNLISMRHVLANDFLATPYDECNIFQSRSTELVVFSLMAGEFVTIAWFFFFLFSFAKLMSNLQADSTWSPNCVPWDQVMAP